MLNGRSFKWITVTLYWFYKLPKSKKLSGAWNKIYSTHPIQHMSPRPKWLGVRLQSSNGCCWEIKSHWRQLFSKFIFPEFFCLADLLSAFLSDILIVKNPIVTNCWDSSRIMESVNSLLSLPFSTINRILFTKYFIIFFRPVICLQLYFTNIFETNYFFPFTFVFMYHLTGYRSFRPRSYSSVMLKQNKQ